MVPNMSRFYAFESWALIVLGAVHVGATFRIYGAFTAQALWFMSAGLLSVLVGALNLLNRTYGRNAPGLRRVCIAANIAVTAFAVASGIFGRASLGAWILVLGIVVPLTVLSCLRMVHDKG
jgi:hypothetical protein